ncbi:MAG: hypothetical protein LBC68_03000 [Prevotellaceae bacterium]|jgi:lipopolysaccharide export LptBFGC system permease protein LptF|nr:hypothetical protein [Prevotellaceae bacterium]
MKKIIVLLSFVFALNITANAQNISNSIAENSNVETKKFNHLKGKYLEIDGANIYYEEIENTGKPVLLFLHGGFGNILKFSK